MISADKLQELRNELYQSIDPKKPQFENLSAVNNHLDKLDALIMQTKTNNA